MVSREVLRQELDHLVRLSPPDIAPLFTRAWEAYLAEGRSRYFRKRAFKLFNRALEEHKGLLYFTSDSRFSCSCGDWGLPAQQVDEETATRRHRNHRAGALLAVLADVGLLDLVTDEAQHSKES